MSDRQSKTTSTDGRLTEILQELPQLDASKNSILIVVCGRMGRGAADEAIRTVWDALDRLVVETPEETYCQPCRSPVWDTALAGHALEEAIEAGADGAYHFDVIAACDWLVGRQITDLRGDWAVAASCQLKPGGWAFQYCNSYFPDVDDTSVVAMLLLCSGRAAYAPAIERARQ